MFFIATNIGTLARTEPSQTIKKFRYNICYFIQTRVLEWRIFNLAAGAKG